MDAVFQWAVFVFGLLFGSFLNVCIYRLPRGLSVVAPRSSCPRCQAPVKFYDNVPLLSWLLLGGRCRRCHTPISVRYMVVELLTGIVFLLCYAKLGFTLEAVKCALFAFLLLGLIFTDAETKLLPDKLTLPGLVLGLVFSLGVPVNDMATQLVPALVSLPVSSDISSRLLSFIDALVGAGVGASFIYGAGAIYLRWRGIEGMGFGDVKLMAMVGAFLGLRLTVLTLFAATLVGSFFGLGTVLVVWIKRTRRRIRRHHENRRQARRRAWHSAAMVYRYYQMPFGVFLGSMALLAFFFGHQILRWYWGLV